MKNHKTRRRGAGNQNELPEALAREITTRKIYGAGPNTVNKISYPKVGRKGQNPKWKRQTDHSSANNKYLE